MIIYGTRGVTYTKGNGDFYCPTCRGNESYRHRRVRRFFTLFFIPLIPFELRGEYIECERCKGSYRMEVLDIDPARGPALFEAEFHRAIKRVMVEMMLADGAVDSEEVAVIKRIYGRLAGTEISDEDVQSEIMAAQDRKRDLPAVLSEVGASLNDNGKEMVVKAAFMVAAADGVFREEEKQLIGSIGEVLQMTPSHMSGVIASMIEEE